MQMRERPEVGTRIASALRAGRSTNLNILPESMALQLSRRGTHGDRLFFVQLIAGFLRSYRSFKLLGRRRSFVGVELGFAATGDGRPGIEEGARTSIWTYAR